MLPASFQEMMSTPGVSPGDTFLLALSGGIDSVALFHLMQREGLRFAVAHANFGLRGGESEEDESFVRDLAAGLDVPVFIRKFDTGNYASEKGISTQMAARELRYTWMRELMDEHRFGHLVTAHHLDDDLETIIFNLAKGTGITGLRGMLPLQNGVFRPLLYTSRAEIETWMKAEGLSWREDSSNAEAFYTRNFIRHRIIPLLRQINPSLSETFRTTLRRVQDADRLIQEECARLSSIYVRQDGGDIRIHRDAFADGNTAVAERLLAPYGLSFTQLNDLLKHVQEGGTTCLFLTGGYRINVDREDVIISSDSPSAPPLRISPKTGEYDHLLGRIEISVEPDSGPVLSGRFEASLDFDHLREPLIIRKWNEGDRFIPLGMTGKKKISDFMIDEKIPLNLKERVYVLESGGEIAWVIGHRISHSFRITRSTVRRFNITISDDQSV